MEDKKKINVSDYRRQIRLIRDECINHISSYLKDTDEDHPLECDITIGEDGAYAVSPLEMPIVKRIYKERDSIYVDIDGCAYELFFIETCDLLTIVDELQEHYSNFANDGE